MTYISLQSSSRIVSIEGGSHIVTKLRCRSGQDPASAGPSDPLPECQQIQGP